MSNPKRPREETAGCGPDLVKKCLIPDIHMCGEEHVTTPANQNSVLSIRGHLAGIAEHLSSQEFRNSPLPQKDSS